MQNFPPKALQLVFVSRQPELLRSYPETPFSIVSVMAQGRDTAAWKDQAAREASGDFVYFLSEDVIFDNNEDLLRLSEFFLENPEISAAVGYDVCHRLIGRENHPTPQIFSSEVWPQTGEVNLCVRREVIESGFLFSSLVMGANPIEELKSLGLRPEKLKWLQLHHKKHLPLTIVYFLRAWDSAKQMQKAVWSHPFTQKAVQSLRDLYNSERTQKAILQTRALAIQALIWVKGRAENLKPLAIKVTAELVSSAKHLYRAGLNSAQKLKKSQDTRSQEKVFVPHLTSDDRSKGKATPRFVLKSREEKDLNP